ncbi:hypothetical protein ACSFBI_26490 [Variovorax sp. RB3P1]|uniref:hypothetical protein n=1 Tax=Variovorax sp. RB3P1 TaxID=3443732 RepID=UPI003F478157
MKRNTTAVAVTLLALTGCMSVSEVIQVPADKQSAVASFRLPVTPSDASETVVYVVNKSETASNKWDRGVIFTTALAIEGAMAPLETVPGQYAIAKIKPGKYAVRAQRLCHPDGPGGNDKESFPPAGTVMPAWQTGWSTYTRSYGPGLRSGEEVFEFQGGKTYVFSINPNCALVVKAGGVLLYPRIRETDEPGGKYLIMSSVPARRQ